MLRQGECFVSLGNSQPVKSSDFGIEHLKEFGVWTWSQDLHASEDSLVPVALTEEGIAEAESLIIHSKLTTASQRVLEGAIFYQLGGDVFAIEAFVDGESFTLNKHLPDMATEPLKRLASVLGDSTEDLLPVRYSVVPKELAIEDGVFAY